MEKLITPKEAAEMLGITPNCLRLWEKAGKIKAVKTMGQHRRYELKEIQNIRNKNARR